LDQGGAQLEIKKWQGVPDGLGKRHDRSDLADARADRLTSSMKTITMSGVPESGEAAQDCGPSPTSASPHFASSGSPASNAGIITTASKLDIFGLD
jgi:hypothetical protein